MNPQFIFSSVVKYTPKNICKESYFNVQTGPYFNLPNYSRIIEKKVTKVTQYQHYIKFIYDELYV